MDNGRFEDKVVVVTGAASGIGRAIVTAFVREGAKGVIADIDLEWANMVADNLRSEGGEVLVCTTDVSKADQVDAMMAAVLENFGRLDVFVNNAGVGVHKEVVNLTEEDWDYQVDVQLKGAFLCSRAAARQLVRQGGGGRIINIGSGAATNARIQAAPHCASKAAVLMLTKVMALELGKHGITVNCVSPGLTDVSEVSRHGGATPEYVANHLTAMPLGRLARPEEIANMVLFIASDQAEFVTGQYVAVDGGYGAGKYNIRGPHRDTRGDHVP
jgi:NAD(P)-dependent dehydrogenase (short-subunit alcohol dehydrogenase family)